jgi:hypothetical protein
MRILKLCSFFGFWALTNSLHAQSAKQDPEIGNSHVANGVVIHVAQGVEKNVKSEASVSDNKDPMSAWGLEQWVHMKNDCEQKMNAASDPKDKERYASELLEIKKKIASIETGKEK